MPQTQMFLRTALTEQRIEALEKQLEWVMKYLKVPPEPTQSDEEWEAAAPSAGPGVPPSYDYVDTPVTEPLKQWVTEPPAEPPKQSKIAERVAKGKR